jgi:hypothetical protein
METIIWNAVSMYISSPTGRGQRGTGYQVTLARRAAAGLRREIVEGDLRFCKWLTGLGVSRQLSDNDIIIFLNPSLRCDLPGASLMLVHEAVHHRTDNADQLTEELNTRRISVLYFQDLVGAPWRYKRRDGATAFSPRLHRGGAVDNKLQLSIQESCEAGNQLVDFVLAGEGKDGYRHLINANWVKTNVDWWGGLTNRWPDTRGLYVNLLAAQGPQNAQVIKRILESVLEPFTPTAGYTKFKSRSSADPDDERQRLIAFRYEAGKSDGWSKVKAALQPLLVDSRQKQELESIDERLGRPMGISPPPTL